MLSKYKFYIIGGVITLVLVASGLFMWKRAKKNKEEEANKEIESTESISAASTETTAEYNSRRANSMASSN